MVGRVVPMQQGNQSAATPGSGVLLGDSVAVEVPELQAASWCAAVAEAQRLWGSSCSRTPSAPRTPRLVLPCASVRTLSEEVANLARGFVEALGREKGLREEGRRWEVGRRLASQIRSN